MVTAGRRILERAEGAEFAVDIRTRCSGPANDPWCRAAVRETGLESQWQTKWQRPQAAADGARRAQTPKFLRPAVIRPNATSSDETGMRITENGFVCW